MCKTLLTCTKSASFLWRMNDFSTISLTSHGFESLCWPFLIGFAYSSAKSAFDPKNSGFIKSTMLKSASTNRQKVKCIDENHVLDLSLDSHSFKLFCMGVPVRIMRRPVEIWLTALLVAVFKFLMRWPSSNTTKSAPSQILDFNINYYFNGKAYQSCESLK